MDEELDQKRRTLDDAMQDYVAAIVPGFTLVGWVSTAAITKIDFENECAPAHTCITLFAQSQHPVMTRALHEEGMEINAEGRGILGALGDDEDES